MPIKINFDTKVDRFGNKIFIMFIVFFFQIRESLQRPIGIFIAAVIKLVVGEHVEDFTLNSVNILRRLVVNPSSRCSRGRIFQVLSDVFVQSSSQISLICSKRT